VIARPGNTVVATVPVGINPIGVAVTPDRRHAYVAIDSSNTVSVIRTATNTVVANIPCGTVLVEWPLGHDAFNLQRPRSRPASSELL
jgi:YVTN family beta-propeller protein